MESPRVSARRATLHGLHVSAAAGGLVALLAWLVFHHGPAAAVAGGAWIGGGLLALLSRRGPVAGVTRRPAVHGALLQAYGAALLVLGALLLRRGAGSLPEKAPGRYDRPETIQPREEGGEVES